MDSKISSTPSPLDVNKTLNEVLKGLQQLRSHGELTNDDYDELERLATLMERLVAQLKDDGK